MNDDAGTTDEAEANAILDAARSVRTFLPGLVADAPAVDAALVHALGLPDEAAVPAILAVFDSNDELRDWFGAFVEHGVPPEVAIVLERSANDATLPGRRQPIPATRMECPVDRNFVFYRRTLGAPVPKCPDHGVDLQPAGSE